VIAVNKADEQHETESERSARELSGALRFLRGDEGEWQTPVITCSGLHDVNLDKVWHHVQRHRAHLDATGALAVKRQAQLVDWTRAMVRDRLLARLGEPGMREQVSAAEAAVLAGEITPDQAAVRVLDALDSLR
jgi:LAO/AO transport system kinase